MSTKYKFHDQEQFYGIPGLIEIFWLTRWFCKKPNGPAAQARERHALGFALHSLAGGRYGYNNT
jgi:hypothetical protein